MSSGGNGRWRAGAWESKYTLSGSGGGMRGFALNSFLRALAALPEQLCAGYPSSLLRNGLFFLFIGGVLAYGAGLAWYMLARFDVINLISNMHDDAFYYFQIAYNLASGNFSTFDGGITRTNGYHPLWLFLLTPFYWVFDKEAALFAIKAFEIMLIAGGVALAAAAARLARLPWYLMFAALPMFYPQWPLITGMEAGAALFMLGLFFLAVMLYARNPARWRWPLAAAAFALPWVRLEYIAISLAVTAALCLIEWSRRERAPSLQPSPVDVEALGAPEARGGGFPLLPLWEKGRVRGLARSVLSVKAVVPFLAGVASILVYFAYNRLVFGGIVPVSAATKNFWSQVRWEQEGGYSLAQNFQDMLQISVFDYELLVALEVCAYLLLVWWFARRSGSRKDWLLLAFLVCVFGLAAGHLAKFAQTVLTIHPSLGPWRWYFVPAYLMMALIVPVRCYVAIYFIRRFIGSKSQRAANILSLGIVLTGAAFLLIEADFTEPFQRVETLRVSTRTDDSWIEWTEAVYGGTQFMNRVLPEDSVVGSREAGGIGYFSRFPVVNLDGLVNSYDYFHARKLAIDDAPLYREFGITHFAEPTRLEGSPLNRFNRFELQLRPIGLPADENTAAGTWERIEPHFDHQSAGVGLMVEGRLALAFARSCGSNELVVWSWVGAADGPVFNAWTQTETGLCADAVVLPHDALPPVRVEAIAAVDYLAGLVEDRPPSIRSGFDVHLIEDHLIYVREPCALADVEAMFFLHLYPVDVNDLPDDRKRHGFDNLDFRFDQRGAIFDGRCAAAAALPEYDIARIGTGQYVPVDGGYKHFWEGEIGLER